MKIIQSFWTKPFLQSADFLTDSRLNGGWLARKYNYFSWALSCLQLSQYYDQIELVTDDLGKFILVDKLELPYTHVSQDLNKLDQYDPGLWALGKIYAYSIQETPFLHVDNDIFIWKKFDDRIGDAALSAQNQQTRTIEYQLTFREICRKFTYVPGYLRELEGMKYIPCSNTGIVGGRDIDFFQTYTNEIFHFLSENAGSISENIQTLNTAFVNVVYEQVIFNQLAKVKDRPITYLFPDCIDIPKHLGLFHEAEANQGFVHCLGTYKQSRMVYRLMEIKLRTLYPAYYEKIIDLLASAEI
jgi:uncharacterized protein DUF6734